MNNETVKQSYFEYLKGRTPATLLLRKFFLRPVVNYFSGRVLDIGSGIGEFLELYSDSVGIDVNRDAVSFCSSKGLICVAADIYNLPFERDAFDGILLNNVLEHLEKPENAFMEIKRVLKNKGKLLVELPGKKGFYYDKTHIKFWDREEITSFLQQYGFKDIGAHYFPVPFRFAGDILTHNKLRICGNSVK